MKSLELKVQKTQAKNVVLHFYLHIAYAPIRNWYSNYITRWLLKVFQAQENALSHVMVNWTFQQVNYS